MKTSAERQIYFAFGILLGFFIELFLVHVIADIFDYTLDINSIGKLFNLKPDVVFLNVAAILYSLSNIGIIVIVIFFIIWWKFLNSKKLLIPKIDEDGSIE